MRMHRRTTGRGRVAVATAVGVLAAAGSAAAAFQTLPPGSQVNDDPAAGINKNLSVSGEDPANADVVGGALTAGKPAVPWSVFRQATTGEDQIFSRSFAAGAWTTRGNGTVGGRSSVSPTFSGSLNFDQGQNGEAPAIDFAGAGRTVPWATWYEDTRGTGFEHNNVFASRFDSIQNKWVFAGQGRGTGGVGSVPVPSVNIHTDQSAENPSVAGGSAVNATKPGPWITWQETANSNGQDQIFVSRPLGPGQVNCDGVTPAGVADGTGHVPAIGGFCFQQTGIPRFGTGSADPSLNVDPTRNGVEPDIAFTGNANGVQDGVPWVVWYEKGNTNHDLSGLTHNNEMVFAAKGVGDGVAANGGFHWVAVGSQGSATLDATGANHFGGCAASDTAEAQCSLNRNPNVAAEDPRVASGTMNPANATVPWVTWDEDVNGVKQVFVSRLSGGTHFQLVNNGAPISIGGHDSTRPDITFSGNTPYVTWRENVGGGVEKAFVGHFVNAANPTFVLDQRDVSVTPTKQADVREPISSSCIATPFNNDGQACQGAAVGTPFFLFTNGNEPRRLFADAYRPDTPMTGAASQVGTTSATLSGSVNPRGASVNVSFQFGTTTAYGQSVAAQTTGPDNAVDQFSAGLNGLPAGTTIHYRAVATSDFGTFAGADRTLQTRSPIGNAIVSGTTASVPVSVIGAAGARSGLALTLTRRGSGVLGRERVTIAVGRSHTVLLVGLNRAGKRLLAKSHHLDAILQVDQVLRGGRLESLSRQSVAFATPHHSRR